MWYIDALKEKTIDYWSFNSFLRKRKPYTLFATRTKGIAVGLGLKRIRKYSGIYYGILQTV